MLFMTSDIIIRRAGAGDIPFIMRTERLEGYEAFVGCWDAGRHAAVLCDPNYAYFIAEADNDPVGFGILRDWTSVDHVTLIKRVAVAEPGRGHGKALMRALVDAAFVETPVHRLWIGCFPHNVRARRAYEAVGFVAEGIARGSAFFHGKHHDELILAMLRPDWQAMRPAADL
jgi:RimJ/RimL family protein N-acetyltransferase